MYLIVLFGCYIILMNLILTPVANLLIILNFVYICVCVCVHACMFECVRVVVLHMCIYLQFFVCLSASVNVYVICRQY